MEALRRVLAIGFGVPFDRVFTADAFVGGGRVCPAQVAAAAVGAYSVTMLCADRVTLDDFLFKPARTQDRLHSGYLSDLRRYGCSGQYVQL